MRPQSIHEIELWRAEVAAATPGNPALRGWNSYSQCDEDGIVRECLRLISSSVPLSRTFIEIGCGNGLENNTHQLALDGYRGCWVDGDPANIRHIEKELGALRSKSLWAQHSFVTLENVSALMSEFRDYLGTGDIDFFSFDTDGNDIHLVREALGTIAPKLVCVEYNGKFPPPTRLEMDYAPDHGWAHDDYYGASLQSWVDRLTDYTLVCCNLSGVNAFFVRNDLANAFPAYSVEQLYQPCRYWLIGVTGHPHSLKWLKQLTRG